MVEVKLDLREIKEGESRKTFVIDPSQLEFPQEEFTFKGGIHGDLILSRRGREITVNGQIAFRANFSCSRCLLPCEKTFTEEISLRYLKGSPKLLSGVSGIKEQNLSTIFYEGNVIEMGGALRDIILLSYPVKHLCKEGCKGLCQNCGQDLNERDCGCPLAEIDSGWKGLKELA